MQISKKDFHRYLSEYTEDEIFYRNTYLQRTEHPETFREYLKNLDPAYIQNRRLYVPELREEPWFPSMGENDVFANIPENIVISKHFRYTPEFTHKHDFFEILCVYDGTVSNQIQGIHHTLHTGDICIIPPATAWAFLMTAWPLILLSGLPLSRVLSFSQWPQTALWRNFSPMCCIRKQKEIF